MKLRYPEQWGDLIWVVAFTPKGGCPLKHESSGQNGVFLKREVAFTPKGGCPLKHVNLHDNATLDGLRSIHPQGWVPIETLGNLRRS